MSQTQTDVELNPEVLDEIVKETGRVWMVWLFTPLALASPESQEACLVINVLLPKVMQTSFELTLYVIVPHLHRHPVELVQVFHCLPM